MECPFGIIGCEIGEQNKDSLLSHLHEDTLEHAQLLLNCINNVKNKVSGMNSNLEMNKLEIDYLKEESRMKDGQMRKRKDEMTEMMAQQRKEMLDQLTLHKKDVQKQIMQLQREQMTLQKKEMMEEMMLQKEMMLQNEITLQKEMMEQMKLQLNEIMEKMTLQKKEMLEQMKLQKQEMMLQKKEIVEIIETLIEKEEQNRMETESMKQQLRLIEEKINEFNMSTRDLNGVLLEKDSGENVSIISMNQKERNVRTQFCNLDEEMKAELVRMVNERQKLYDLPASHKLYSIFDEDFVWRIEINPNDTEICKFSESFYSNNYKFCLRFRIVGDDIRLYCYIEKGENDDKVEWPLRLPVTLSIINQHTMKAHKKVTHSFGSYSHNKDAFSRTYGERNKFGIGGYYILNLVLPGMSSFIQYSSIVNNSSIIVNNNIMVACTIDDVMI